MPMLTILVAVYKARDVCIEPSTEYDYSCPISFSSSTILKQRFHPLERHAGETCRRDIPQRPMKVYMMLSWTRGGMHIEPLAQLARVLLYPNTTEILDLHKFWHLFPRRRTHIMPAPDRQSWVLIRLMLFMML
jgi:hypothetical protein